MIAFAAGDPRGPLVCISWEKDGLVACLLSSFLNLRKSESSWEGLVDKNISILSPLFLCPVELERFDRALSCGLFGVTGWFGNKITLSASVLCLT